MIFWTIYCLIALIVILIQSWFWFRRQRLASALLIAVFGFVYFGDLAWISMHQFTFLTVSDFGEVAKADSIRKSILLATATWLAFSLLQGIRMPRRNHRILLYGADKLGSLIFVFMSILVSYSILSLVASVGVADVLEQRQLVFGETLISLLTYYLAPILTVIGFILIRTTSWYFRPLVFLLFILCFFSALFTGSRSGIFLTALLPIIILIWRRSYIQGSGIKKFIVAVLLFLVPTLGGSWFLETARGVSLVPSRAAMDSVDISQADVLIRLIASDSGNVSATYLGSILTLIPRAFWSEKPVPGNVVSSEILAPDRYNLTGSEITSGLLGESFINFGLWGFLSSSILLFLLCRVCDCLLRGWRNEYVACLALLLLFRGMNLLRGDLANVITPSVVALAVWAIIFGRKQLSNAGISNENTIVNRCMR